MIGLKIFGILLLILIAILVLGLTMKIEVGGSWRKNNNRLWIRLGPLTIPLYPFSKRKKKKAEHAQKENKSKEKSGIPLYPENLDFSETLEFGLRFMGELKDALTIARLRLCLTVGGPDAAKTALRYGRIWEIVGLVQPVLEENFRIAEKKIAIDCDFDAKKTLPDAEITVFTRPIRVLHPVWKERKELFRLYHKLTQKEEGKNDQSSHP